jgi:peptidyl-dipeptidase A
MSRYSDRESRLHPDYKSQADDSSFTRRRFLGTAAAFTAVGTSGLPASELSLILDTESEAKAFLETFVTGWLPLETASSKADWVAVTDVTEEHTAEQIRLEQVRNQYVGRPATIEQVKAFLAKRSELSDLTIRQLEEVRLMAAEAPGTIPEVVKARTEAEALQSAKQDGFVYPMKDPKAPDRPITANGIDAVLQASNNLEERLDVWNASKTIGEPLKEGLLKLRDLRNKVARELGFDDFFALQVADYGMTVPEMLDLCESFVRDLSPLYRQLHCWGKHTLAKRYGANVPDGPIPAHWLPNRWGQNWPGLVQGFDMDVPFRDKTKEFITEQAERFYVSLGFPKLPASFWEKSDLYPVVPPSTRKKNSHASAWHIDLEADVRSLMSIVPNNQWFTTAHHELGHIYYYISYSTPKVPHLLRGGANRAFHEGIGDLIGLAASQRPYLKQAGLLPPEAETADPVTFLLDSALDGAAAVFIPFSAGTMTRFEQAFYSGKITDENLNTAWWRIVRAYQGIVPPGPRPEAACDPATKTHINDDAGQYYDYAIGTIIKFQLHDHIAREILKQDPRECNYFGNKDVGRFLGDLLALGATRDWNAVLREATGSGLSAKPMLEYFAPLASWLEKENAGRTLGWG